MVAVPSSLSLKRSSQTNKQKIKKKNTKSLGKQRQRKKLATERKIWDRAFTF
jgi:hypothetical protein